MTKEDYDKIYVFISKKEYWVYFLLFIFPFVYPKTYLKIFDEYFNDLFFQNIKSSFAVDFIFVIFLSLFGAFCFVKYKLEYQINRSRFIILAILCFWYSFARFSSGWNMVQMEYIPFLKYSDILPLILIINGITIFYENRRITRVSPLMNNLRFNPEVELVEDDILNRKKYALQIAESIVNSFENYSDTENTSSSEGSPNHEILYSGVGSFSVGIVGKWGSGKSIFIHRIISHIKAKEDCIVIEFHPWRNHESSNLTKNFFETIREELGKIDSKLGLELRAYSGQLSKLDDNIYVKTIDFMLNIIFGEASVDKLYNQINQSILKLKKKVIVVIDDLDRLEGNEMMEVIKLIRSSSNFKRMAFIVAYDKDYVVNQINSVRGVGNDDFLDKIFLTEFSLPIFENDLLEEYFKKYLTTLMKRSEIELSDSESRCLDLNIQGQKYIFNQCIKSIRDVVRFSNMFIVDYNQVKEEVYFLDFLNIELIKYKFFNVYSFLIQHYGNLLNVYEALVSIDEKKLDDLLKNNLKMPFQTKNLLLQLFHNRVPINVPIVNQDKGEISELELNKSIIVNGNLFGYLAYRVGRNQLTENTFRNSRYSEYEIFCLEINKWILDNKITQILEKFSLIRRFRDEDDFFNVFRALFSIVIKENNKLRGIDILKGILNNQKLSSEILNKVLEFISQQTPETFEFKIEIVDYLFDHSVNKNQISSEAKSSNLQNLIEEALGNYNMLGFSVDRLLVSLDRHIVVKQILSVSELSDVLLNIFDSSFKKSLNYIFKVRGQNYESGYFLWLFDDFSMKKYLSNGDLTEDQQRNLFRVFEIFSKENDSDDRVLIGVDTDTLHPQYHYYNE